MWKFIRRQNIRQLRERLSTTSDASERERLSRIIAEEEAKLIKGSDKLDPDLPVPR